MCHVENILALILCLQQNIIFLNILTRYATICAPTIILYTVSHCFFKHYSQHNMDLYNVDAIHIYSFSGLPGKRLVAYRSETAGHVAILKTDVA